MQLRKTLGAAALITTAVFASVAGCSGRDDGDGETPDAGPGCTGACGTDAGTDAGTDGGPTTLNCPDPLPAVGPIGTLRTTGQRGDKATLTNVVVTAVSNVSRGSLGDYIARFWVVNPCFPKEGMYVDKYFTDVTTNYEPVVGDVLTVSGVFRRFKADATDNLPSNRDAYRPVLKNDFLLAVQGSSGKVTITKLSSGPALPDVTNLPANFGNSEGGTTKPNADYAGARVHIPGPITITNATPFAMKQRPEDPDSGTYLGFEVTGGVLVGNYKTFSTCDLRLTAEDGGTVTFPNGIRGVYETYTNPPCTDGGVVATDGGSTFRCNAYGDGVIPGTTNDYTYVVYPMNCDPDMAGSAAP